jgi:hypothetical protein
MLLSTPPSPFLLLFGTQIKICIISYQTITKRTCQFGIKRNA